MYLNSELLLTTGTATIRRRGDRAPAYIADKKTPLLLTRAAFKEVIGRQLTNFKD